MSKLHLSLFIVASMAYAQPTSSQVEPNAGNWKTWVITSGKDFRVPPPPDSAGTQQELQFLKSFTAEAQTDSRIPPQIKYWDAGSPAYRWIDLISNRNLTGQPLAGFPRRVYVYVALALHDATIATWESKYFYNRPRPSVLDPSLPAAVAVPRSPSYPSEHAAAAAAAAEVLAFLIPAEAQSFRDLATEAARSRVYAGVQYPSDYFAGLELGRQVAARVIAKARADGTDTVWTGTIPTGPCMWVGTNPGNVTGPFWKPLLLTSVSEFRPPPPPSCNSAAVQAEVAAVRNVPRSPAAFATNERAMYWQSVDGREVWNYRLADKWMAEDRLDQNPPRASRVYALLAATQWDAFAASQDGKFAYWYLRPHMLDSAIVPLFPVPNFPSYPSNHSTLSSANAEMLSYLFPTREGTARTLGKEAGDSRIWAGIHYEMDNQSGAELGRKVAQKFIDWAKADGSQ